VEKTDVDSVSQETLTEVEADCFWCLTKLLDGIQVLMHFECAGVVWCLFVKFSNEHQDNYTAGQPGIQRQISRLKELINRIDGECDFSWGKQMDFVLMAGRSVCSPSLRTFAVTRNRVYSICVSVDELYADAGTFVEKYHTHVGLLSGLFGLG
jgi:hypothetical protein